MAPPPRGPDGDYYQVLGVEFDAQEEEIRKRYHTVVRTLHPDRRRPSNTSHEALERFHKVQNAWRVLSDGTRRLLYDLRNFGRSSLGAEFAGDIASVEQKLILMQREQARIDVRNMEVEVETIVRRERKARGILIRAAIYGDLRLREDRLDVALTARRPIQPEDLVGPLIDVALPMQCLVERHRLLLPGGALASKADLPGFYNPTPLNTEVELSLYVLYDFRGQLHEVIVGDRETLSLPFRRHQVAPGQGPRGPFSPANAAMLQTRATRARRRADPGKVGNEPAEGQVPAAASDCPDAEEAFEKEMVAYVLQRLLPGGPGEVSTGEFLAVALCAGAALALAMRWAYRGSR